MSNALFHNKWHGFNHYTLPIGGFPDSATDPIASAEHPFKGIFYNSIAGNFGSTIFNIEILKPGKGYTKPPLITLSPNLSLSGAVYIQPNFIVGVENETTSISSITIIDGGRYKSPISVIVTPASGDIILQTLVVEFTGSPYPLKSDSYGWWYYSSLTYDFSGQWQLYPSVKTTTRSNSSNWNLGYNGYLTQHTFSGKWESVFAQTSSLSGEEKYDFSGGRGWHIALSGITHRVNVSDQIDICQKAAVPVRLYERNDNTIWWHTSAQTVYYNLTANKPLTATNVFDARKGGKYTMWLYVDACPEEFMNVVFDKQNYNITVKGWDGFKETWRDTYNNVLLLSASSLTRIDFVYDGFKMLGRATRYKGRLDQTEDLYFMGTGLRFVDPERPTKIKNPVFISSIYPNEGKAFANDLFDSKKTGIFIVAPYINYPDRPVGLNSDFDANSSLYVGGSGIFFRYLDANNCYFSFNAFGGTFPTERAISRYSELTASFDRVITTLSAGDWKNPIYAENLVVTPDISLLTTTISAAFRQPPYLITSSNIRAVSQCTSSYRVEIYSGKDRDIANVYVNQIPAPIQPIVVNGMAQTYNFQNERTCVFVFERIQSDFTVDVYFTRQTPATILKNILSFNSMNSYSLFETSNLITRWDSNTVDNDYKLIQNNTSNSPVLSTNRALRQINFGGNKFMTINKSLSSLSSNKINFFNSFSTFTSFRTNKFPISSVIWWMGDFTGSTEQKGFGLVLSASKNDSLTARLFTVSNYKSMGEIRGSIRDVTVLEANKNYVIGTNYDSTRRFIQEVYVNNKFSTFQRNLGVGGSTMNTQQTNLDLVFGKKPNENSGYSNVNLYDFYMFEKKLTRAEIIKMNRYLLEKIDGYKLV